MWLPEGFSKFSSLSFSSCWAPSASKFPSCECSSRRREPRSSRSIRLSRARNSAVAASTSLESPVAWSFLKQPLKWRVLHGVFQVYKFTFFCVWRCLELTCLWIFWGGLASVADLQLGFKNVLTSRRRKISCSHSQQQWQVKVHRDLLLKNVVILGARYSHERYTSWVLPKHWKMDSGGKY